MWLLNYCLNNDIGVIYRKSLPSYAPSVSYENPKLVIFNDNFQDKTQKPFMLAHEIGHVVEGNSQYYKLSHLGMNRGEYSANIFAINLLWEYCLDSDIWFETIYDFATSFGIPHECWYLLERIA